MKLIDVCELIVDCPHSTAKDEGQGIPLVRTPNIGKGRLELSDVHRVSEAVYNQRIERAVPEAGDLILAREAPVGNVALIMPGQKVCLGQRVVLIRPDKEKADPAYLTYYLLSEEVQHRLKNNANGAVVAHLNMNEIRNLVIELPEISIQKRIASVLSSLDDKIALNNRINHNLEEQAQALYKSWFVDFDPFKGGKFVDSELGMIPEGWTVAPLGCIATISSGKRPPFKSTVQNEEYQIPVLGASSVMAYTSEYLIEGLYIITGRVGTLGELQRVKGKIWPSDNTLVISSDYYNFVYQVLREVDYSSLNRGSTQPLLTQSDLKSWPIVLPPEDVLNRFESCSLSLTSSILMNIEQNGVLRNVRDSILPVLMHDGINS